MVNITANIPLGGTFVSRVGGPGMLIKDAYSGIGEEARVAHYDIAQNRAVFRELACGICGSPMPASHRRCEVYLYDEHFRKKQKAKPKNSSLTYNPSSGLNHPAQIVHRAIAGSIHVNRRRRTASVESNGLCSVSQLEL